MLLLLVVICSVLGFYLYCEPIKGYKNGGLNNIVFWILGTTLGCVGAILGHIVGKRIEKKNDNKRRTREKEQTKQYYVKNYGAESDEINKRIVDSNNTQIIVAKILELPYHPYTINIGKECIWWSVRDNEGKESSKHIYYEDIGATGLPQASVKALALALAQHHDLKGLYEYAERCSDWGDTYMLCIRSEQRLSGLNKW